MKNSVNLADKEKVLELMKKLYGNDEVRDDQEVDTERETGADGARELAQLPPNCS